MTRHHMTGPHVVRSVPTGPYGTVRCPDHPDFAKVVESGHDGARVIAAHLTAHHRTADNHKGPTDD